MTPNFHQRGLLAENYFIEKIKQSFPDYLYVDDYYDFDLDGTKVEVKSCLFRSKNGRYKKSNQNDHCYIYGRFDFTNPTNREKIIEENIWLAFILRSHDDFMLLGFVEPKNLKIKRYVRMEDVLRSKPLSLEQFKQQIQIKKMI